jgi:hypothetical protein
MGKSIGYSFQLRTARVGGGGGGGGRDTEGLLSRL